MVEEMGEPEMPRRGLITFDSERCKLEREETERGRALILSVMPGALFNPTLQEIIEEGVRPRTPRKRLPPRGHQ